MEDLPPPTMKITPEGNYFLIENEAKPPDPISGNFHKLGHFFKTWKYRFIIVVSGVLSYYQTNSFSSMSLKGTIPLKGYSIRKYSKQKVYLWYSGLSLPQTQEKDLLLHIPTKSTDNQYSIQIWIQAIRAHIRYANGTYVESMNWFPSYQASQENRSVQYHGTYQVVSRAGVSVQCQYDESSTFATFLKHYDMVEITALMLNHDNSLRGKLKNGDGWVTITSNDGQVYLTELREFEEVNSETEEQTMDQHLPPDDSKEESDDDMSTATGNTQKKRRSGKNPYSAHGATLVRGRTMSLARDI